ncbi:23S ribosomal RNA methyltransferase Erm [Nocardia arthritidis]|uniref:23S ribosomal RNA methyltransferase Erm n=1 Tax=Nocardia arthritidis TaxID=228602 RepID=A0A6G9YIH9_9NOCA|nr:23S ribosomal RNA methyltransferase Erm [Nocardia arthritidis]QIS13012.1 23S ribosomal RNA methyltransferase Erm [Nocardia arthritidis]
MSRHRSLPHAREAGVRTRKRLSQNFLTDTGIARAIVRASGVGADDLVVEIGPGAGILTRELVGCRRLLAYEKDPGYAALLRDRYLDDPRIRCYHMDFRAAPVPREPFAVVANIPFGSSTDILRWCLAARRLTSATLLTQLEFARKYAGAYGRWTRLSVGQWPWLTMELGPKVSRFAFDPVPRVDAGVLLLRRRPEPLLPMADFRYYRRTVELGFSGVGGSLARSLRRGYPAGVVRDACAAAGIDADMPVGLVAPDSWLTLYRKLRGR